MQKLQKNHSSSTYKRWDNSFCKNTSHQVPVAFPIQSKFLSTKEISLLRSKLGAPWQNGYSRVKWSLHHIQQPVWEYAHHLSMRLVMLKCHYNRAPDLAALLLPLFAFNKAKIKRLTRAITLKVMFPPSVPCSDAGNMNSVRVLNSVGLDVWVSVNPKKMFKYVSELWGFLPDTMPDILAFQPSPPPFQLNLLGFFRFFPFFLSISPMCLLTPRTAIRSSFFPHSSSIPQLFRSFKSEEFKDPALNFLSV